MDAAAPSSPTASASSSSSGPSSGSWRQSLGAGLLLGLALGCGWLARWTPQLFTRLLLVGGAAVLAVVALNLLLSLAGSQAWAARWQRRMELPFAGTGVPFMTALVILGLLAILSGNNLIYLMVSGLVAALLLSGAVATLNLSGMELRFRLPAEIFARQPTAVTYTLTNAKAHWPAYSLTLSAASRPLGDRAEEAELHPEYFAYLAGGGSQTGQSEIVYPRRGRYTAAAFILSTRFPFGLLHKRRHFHPSSQEAEMLIFPQPAPDFSLEAALQRASAGVARGLRGEGQDLYRIRPHQLGDSARQVHWKASARAGELRVREFGDEQAPRLRLRVALPAGLPLDQQEAALSLATAWLLACVQAGLWLQFVGENALPDGQGLYLPLAPALRHRRAVLEYLALADPDRSLIPAPAAAAADSTLGEILIDGQ